MEKKKTSDMRFPLFVSLTDKKIIVAGGGNIAARRIETLLQYGADITVIAPHLIEQIVQLQSQITCLQRCFEEEDVSGAYLVIAATNDRVVNHNIYKICKEEHILISVADCMEECSFFFPAVCVNSKISIGMVSDGTNHTYIRNIAKKVRELISHEEA